MKTIFRKNRKLFIYALFLCIAVFLPYIIFNHGIIIIRGDPYELNLKLWQGGWQAVHDGTLGQFEWSLGLGANTFSYVFYFLTSPFFWISCLFPKSFLPYSVLVFQIIEMWLGFMFAFCWLKKIVKSDLGATVGAFIIAFCAYNFFYTQVEQILKLIFLYPLILYFTECWMQEGKWKGLLFSVALTGISNYYVLYQFVPFLIVYVILRWILLHKINQTKETRIWVAALKYFGIMVLALGLCAVILIPCAELVLGMPRFSSSSVSWGDHLDRWQIFRIFTSLFIPTFQKLDANAYISAGSVSTYGWSGGAPLYSLILTPIIAPLVLKLKDKHAKRFSIIFTLILLVFMFFLMFSYLFQFSVDTRWYYMVPFFSAVVVALVLDAMEQKQLDHKKATVTGVVTVALMWGCYAFSCIKQLNDESKLKQLAIVLICLSILAVFYIFLCRSRATRKKWIIVCSLEALLSGVIFYWQNKPIDWWAFNDEAVTSDIGTYLQDTDSGFYRVQYDNKSVMLKEDATEDDALALMTGNEPYANGYNGFGFYESVYNTNQEEFLWRLKSSWNMTQMIGRTRTYNMLSSKYWYTFDYSDPIPYGYKKVYSSEDGYDLYENENYVELGYTYENTVNKDYLLDQSFLDQDLIMSEYLVTEDSTNTSVTTHNNITYLATLPAEDIRTYTFDEPVSNVILYIETYGLPETKVTLMYKGEKLVTYDAWQFNYVDIPVYQEIDEIVIEAKAVYSKQTEINLYEEPMDGSYETQWKETTAEHFTNVNYDGDFVEGDITVADHKKYVFTSVPYDTGWTVTVDGQTIDYEKVQMGFIGFQLEPGEHHITFSYHIPGLTTGAAVSSVTVTAVIILCLFERRKKKNLRQN
ncbi:MAG: YfhO family protein [Solobacterium sp.]|jgi:uncharacterized membrane protein YfhO|nr:YfhO family protein [Solobacterium sp.]